MGRSTSGVRIQRIKGEEDRVSSCAIVPADDEVEESTEGAVDGDAPVAEAVGEEPVAEAVEPVEVDDAEDELVIEDEDASSDDE